MHFGFTDDQEDLRDAVRSLLADRAGPEALRAAFASADGTDPALWREIVALGWPSLTVAERHGGLGRGLVELAIVQEELGRHLAAVPFFSTVCLAAPAVPSPAFLEAVAGGRTATFAFGEREPRWDRCRTTAAPDPATDGWVLSGVKRHVCEAHLADDIVVTARTPRGVSLFLVPRADLRRSVRPADTIDPGRRLGDVFLTGVSVRRDQLVGEEGRAHELVEPALDRAAVALAAEAVGVAGAALDLAVGYARTREQFGRVIGTYQAISHRCADIYAAVESARSAVYYAAWALEEAVPDARLAVATAKVAANEAVRLATTGCVQIHGGTGFTWDHDAHLYFRRGRFCETFLGTSTTWRDRVVSLRAAS